MYDTLARMAVHGPLAHRGGLVAEEPSASRNRLQDAAAYPGAHAQQMRGAVSYEHPVVVPQVMHFKHVPLRTMVN